MKTCPKCGAKMEADVNFCTECGTDIRNVPVEEVEVTQTVTRSEESVAQTSAPKRSEQATKSNDSQSQVAGLGQDFAQSMKSFDVNNMWQWFVNSWKHPFAEQNADKWYGWITLLAEDILVALGLFIGSQRATSSILGQDFAGSTARFTFGMALELIFFLLLTQAAWIGAAYLSYKVIYNQNKNFLQLTNHIVQTSNLSAIFIVVYFVFMLLAGPGGVVMSTIMIWLSVALFGMALTVVVVGDPNPVHDKLYGYLLFLVLQFITGAIMTILIFSTVLGQFGSALHLY